MGAPDGGWSQLKEVLQDMSNLKERAAQVQEQHAQPRVRSVGDRTRAVAAAYIQQQPFSLSLYPPIPIPRACLARRRP
jgi:hypothetical protein